jgi:hypothetical protein
MPGKYTIPQTKFSFFNPKVEEYITIYSDPIYIDVEGVNKNSSSDNDSNELNTTNKIQLAQNQFASFKTKTKFSKIGENIFFNSTAYWILFSSPFLICILIIVLVKFLKIYNSKKIDKLKIAKGLTQKLLVESKGLIGNKEKFYESIDKALTTYLKSKLNLDNSQLNNKYIHSRLQQMKVEKNLIDLLFNVLENCQLARYTPLNIEAMSEDYENAKLFIEQLEKVKNEK